MRSSENPRSAAFFIAKKLKEKHDFIECQNQKVSLQYCMCVCWLARTIGSFMMMMTMNDDDDDDDDVDYDDGLMTMTMMITDRFMIDRFMIERRNQWRRQQHRLL